MFQNKEKKLIDAATGESCEILRIDLRPETTRRMEMLGMTKGAKIQVMNRKRSGSMIIKVRGTRFALGRNFVKGITVGGIS